VLLDLAVLFELFDLFVDVFEYKDLDEFNGLLVKLVSDKISIVLNGDKSASVRFRLPLIIWEVFKIPLRIELANDIIENFLTVSG
jgi:hypothetical protein